MDTTLVAGTFCWVDLGTDDPALAMGFYSELFGWEHHPVAVGNHPYLMLSHGGKSVAAMYPQAQGFAGWLGYVLVSDLEQAVARAESLGAVVLKAAQGLGDSGRLAVLADPTGAAFALWQAGLHAGADLFNQPGSLCWHELLTGDPDRAADFYQQLFGWQVRTEPFGESQYRTFRLGERAVGGLMPLPEVDEHGPSWLAYFAVADCDDVVARALELQGTVSRPPIDIPGVGRFAVLNDPQGFQFAVIKLT